MKQKNKYFDKATKHTNRLFLSLAVCFSFYACSVNDAKDQSKLSKFDIKSNDSEDIARRSPLCVSLSKDVKAVKDLTVDRKWSFNPFEWKSKEDKQRHDAYKKHYATYAKATAIELQLHAAAKMLNIPHDEQAVPVMTSWLNAFAPNCSAGLTSCKEDGCQIGDPSFATGWAMGMFGDQWKTSQNLFDSPSIEESIQQCGPTKPLELTKSHLHQLFGKLDKTCAIQKTKGDTSYEELVYHEPAVKGVVIDRYFNVGGDKEILKGMCLHEEKLIDRFQSEKKVDATYALVQTVAQFSISAGLAFLATPKIMKEHKKGAIPILLGDEVILLSVILLPSVLDLRESLNQRANLKFVSSCHHDVLSKRIGRRISVISTDIIGAAISATIGVGVFSAGAHFSKLIRNGSIKFVSKKVPGKAGAELGEKAFAFIKDPGFLTKFRGFLAKSKIKLPKGVGLPQIFKQVDGGFEFAVPDVKFVSGLAQDVVNHIPFLGKSQHKALLNLAEDVGENYRQLFNLKNGDIPNFLKVHSDGAATGVKDAADHLTGLDSASFLNRAISAYKETGKNAIHIAPKAATEGKQLAIDLFTRKIDPADAAKKVFVSSGLTPGEAVGPAVVLAASSFSRVYARVKKVKPDYEEVTKSYDDALNRIEDLDSFRKEIQLEIEQTDLIPSL